MTTDKKQPPDTDRWVLVRLANDRVCVGRHRHPRATSEKRRWQMGNNGKPCDEHVIDWRKIPPWDRLAILDRYDKERAEWERNIAGFKTAAEKWHREYKEVEARADRAEKERDEAREWRREVAEALDCIKDNGEIGDVDYVTRRARALAYFADNTRIATEERDRAIAERDDLGCQLEALRAVQRDDMQALLGRVASLEKWRVGAERLFPLLVDADCFGMTEDEIRKELAADGIDLDESRARLTARWRRILSETEADDDEKGGA